MSAAQLLPGGDETVILHFEEGILGFEDTKEYVLLKEDDRNVMFTFQSAREPVPSLVVLNPFAVLDDYVPELPQKDAEWFGVSDPSELVFLLVTVLRDDGSVWVNKKAPIVIHPETCRGKQVLLENDDYAVRHKLF